MRKNPVLYSFILLLSIFTILDIVNNDKYISTMENRKLTLRPKFSIKSFVKGDVTSRYEKYIDDQIIFRDSWISIKSKLEYTLGKRENNKIVFGKDGYLFEKFDKVDSYRVKKNTEAVKGFTKKIDIPASVILAPNSYEVYKKKLPKGIELINQNKAINEIYNELNYSNNIYLLEEYKNIDEEYLYYRTDHHWTSYGAYIAYKAYLKSIGEIPVDIYKLEEKKVENFYGSYFSKSKFHNAVKDTISYYDFPNIKMCIDDIVYDSMYDYEKIKESDKYSLFLRGNSALTIIKNTSLKNNKKIIVIKDSFANSFVPFLTQNYEEIHIVDMRTFSSDICEYIENNMFNQILILYNLISFMKDTNINKLNN